MRKALLLALIPMVLIACNAGNAPTGGSDEEIKATFDKMPLEDKVKFYMNSPMPLADKKKKIEEAYQKDGKQIPPELAAQLEGGAPATPAAGAPPIDTTGQKR